MLHCYVSITLRDSFSMFIKIPDTDLSGVLWSVIHYTLSFRKTGDFNGDRGDWLSTQAVRVTIWLTQNCRRDIQISIASSLVQGDKDGAT